MGNSSRAAHWSKKITRWLKDYLKSSECTGFVFGLSGGLDSSVTAVLCRRVTPNSLGLILPCAHTPKDSNSDALILAKQFSIETKTYNLTPAYDAFQNMLSISDTTSVTIPLANVKARLRMIALYYEANRLNRLVVGTGNRTELAFGYFTKYGDAGVDILPLGRLLKREVRELAHYLDIPKQIILKIPSPGLWPGQTDEGELGASYDQLDDMVIGRSPKGLSKEEITRLHSRMTQTEHKRKLPPICPL